MRGIILFWLVPLGLFATTINESLLKIHANLFPKTVMMDYHYEKKLVDGMIQVVLLHKSDDLYYANRLKEMIESHYPDGIRNTGLRVLLHDYEQLLSYAPAATAYYLFPALKRDIEQAVALSRRQQYMSFSYDADDLQRGVMVSLKITEKVTPWINAAALKEGRIVLRPMLLEIAKLFFH